LFFSLAVLGLLHSSWYEIRTETEENSEKRKREEKKANRRERKIKSRTPIKSLNLRNWSAFYDGTV